MKIPDEIKLAGHRYKIIWDKNMGRDYETTGRSNVNKLTIELDPSGQPSHIQEIFWHEIIEQINYRFELNLQHDKISILGASIHQVIADNPELFTGDE